MARIVFRSQLKINEKILTEKLEALRKKVTTAASRAVYQGYNIVEDSLLGGGPHSIPQPEYDPSKPPSQPHLSSVVRSALLVARGRFNIMRGGTPIISAGMLDRTVLDSYTVAWQREKGQIMTPFSGESIPVWKLYEFGSRNTGIMTQEKGHRLRFPDKNGGGWVYRDYVNKPTLPKGSIRPPSAGSVGGLSDLFSSPDAGRGYAPIRHAFRKLAIAMPSLFNAELQAMGVKSKLVSKAGVKVGRYVVRFG